MGTCGRAETMNNSSALKSNCTRPSSGCSTNCEQCAVGFARKASARRRSKISSPSGNASRTPSPPPWAPGDSSSSSQSFCWSGSCSTSPPTFSNGIPTRSSCSTLALSFQAAYAAPFIMMSQNRQQDIDRKSAENDFKVNVKAELEIELLHQKIDQLRETEVVNLTAAVKELTAMLRKAGPGAATSTS